MEGVATEDSSMTAGETPKAPVSHSSAPSAPAPHSTSKKVSKSTTSLDDANEELAQLIISGKIKSDDALCLKATLKEHVSLKEKVEKLKSLLGRSAKAQREAKVDSEAAQKRLGQAMKEIERLNKKLDKLQTRPSHLDLLMDFETNFDKALLSVGQTGGQETFASEPLSQSKQSSDIDTMDAMLMQELGESKSRIDKLETLNTAMMSRSTQLEESAKTLQTERDEARTLTKRLQMELRMAKLEADQAQRAMMDKVASLEEMQIEIDLVTKASTKASARAAKGEEAANSLKTEKNHIQQLESQVQALKEWALASAEAKQLMKERCKILESKLKAQQGRASVYDTSNPEKLLFTKTGSMVIGAGDVDHVNIALGEHAATVDSRFVILRWKFDSSPADMAIYFNIVKGKCETSSDFAKADYLVKDREITGGAGGETEGAFNLDSACTILWSNVKSWIRPRTVKYT
eukprot:CAMPEP_0172371582 /NCGR_PEP_ID=MMETSP1060-20121228/43642_1 /TAXON_ID=37318 /ORGANISM="Pseudo-nitzschia pungens, Strain cf. cingulata" /LENGTH=461 /DNA_ID=CAMNT_0013097261 /DNA_START=88 /DNA_END=1469 /DNA_ORIENTATION=+